MHRRQFAAVSGSVFVEADGARALLEADAARLHRLHPWREDLLADIAFAPADVKGVLVLEHKEVGHPHGSGSRTLLPRSEEAGQDHRLERLLVQTLRDPEAVAQLLEGHIVVAGPCLKGR